MNSHDEQDNNSNTAGLYNQGTAGTTRNDAERVFCANGYSEKHISRLINGEVRLTPNVAMRLETILGIPSEFWNNLEAIYHSKKQKAEEEEMLCKE